MLASSGMERRQFLQILAAAGAAGGLACSAIASAAAARGLPAGSLLIGTGGTGCKIVRRAIERGFDPAGFVAIDADADALSASGAAHQIHCGQKMPDGNWAMNCRGAVEARARIDGLLQEATKVVVVGALGGLMGQYWLMEIAARDGSADRHIIERGLDVDVVTTLPRGDEPYARRSSANYYLGWIRRNRAVKIQIGFAYDWRLYLGSCPVLGSLLERELWLTRESLLCALGGPEPSLAA